MKHALRILLVLMLTVVTVLASLSCNRSKQLDENKETDNKAKIEDYEIAFKIPSSYDLTSAHGTKGMYGYSVNTTYRSLPTNEWKNGYFGFEMAWAVFYDLTNEEVPNIACFDPLCSHWDDTCPASYQFDFDEGAVYETMYPMYMFVDYYDNPTAPVMYSIYRRSDVGHLGSEDFDRKAFYVIQRYDVSEGKRETLCMGIEDLISSSYTYGNYVYYTACQDYKKDSKIKSDDLRYYIACIPKSGGDIIKLAPDGALSLEMLDIDDTGVYYLVNARYVYYCSPTLSDPVLLMDFENLKGEEGAVLPAHFKNGYIYYYTNFRYADNGVQSPIRVVDCLRLPMNDLSAEPVVIAENMLYGATFTSYSENYLYYQPLSPNYNTETMELLPNYSNGVIICVDLITGETIVCMDESGVFFACQGVSGDDLTVVGQACTNDAASRGWDSTNITKIYKVYHDGKPFTVWEDLKNEKQFVPPADPN